MRTWKVTLPDYLWGIETGITPINSYFLMSCFQTTYEELKPSIRSSNVSTPALPDYLWGIETKCRKSSWNGCLASRLPMRNWNVAFWVLCSRPGAALPDYLWGIETIVQRAPSPYSSWASRLPMRNWNVASLNFLAARLASRLPMRNWNTWSTWNRNAPRRLPDYLWGIETRSYPTMWVSRHRFQTTYEELKRESPTASLHEPPSFQTTYEELKHLFGQGLLILQPLPDYLWGIETMAVLEYAQALEAASRLPMRNWNTCSFSIF